MHIWKYKYNPNAYDTPQDCTQIDLNFYCHE